MTFSFHPEAEEEFTRAIDYYENTETGIGYDFAVEVYAAIQRIIEYPKAWPKIDNEFMGRWFGDSLLGCYILKNLDRYLS